MTEPTQPVVPRWYWIVATLSIVWNLLGCAIYAVEMFALEAAIEGWEPAKQEWARSLPPWIYVVFGLAVATGVAGSVGLVLRKRWTVPVLALSLVLVLVQMTYTMLISGGLKVMGPSEAVQPIMVIVIAAGLLWFAITARNRGWLR